MATLPDITTGIDLVSVERFRRAAERRPRLLERVFTPGELARAGKRRDPVRHLAGSFAAKEAALKALGTGLAGGVRWHDVEVVRPGGGSTESSTPSPHAQPGLKLTGRAAEVLAGRPTHLSVTFTRELALASVVVG